VAAWRRGGVAAWRRDSVTTLHRKGIDCEPQCDTGGINTKVDSAYLAQYGSQRAFYANWLLPILVVQFENQIF